MRSYRSALAATLGSALLMGMLAGPAAAKVVTEGRMAIVNGRPGGAVEVCLNGKEIKSSLGYGQHLARVANAGSKTLKFRKSSSGTCSGELLAQKSVELAAGSDWVVVLTKSAPGKVLAWDAALQSWSITFVRHAADIGTAGFKYINTENGAPWYPAVEDRPYVKGQFGYGGNSSGGLVFWAHQPPDQKAIAGPVYFVHRDGYREELILVGSSLSNVRFVLFRLPNLAA